MNFGFYPALTIAVVGLLCLELGKRLTIEPIILDLLKIKKVRFGLLLVFVGLSAISIYSSFEGSKLAVNELSNNSDIVNIDSLERANRAKIDAINAKIGEYKEDKQYRNSDDVIFYNVSAKLIPKLEGQIITQTSINTAAVDSANVYNSRSNATHQASSNAKGLSLGYITILSELLLILCLSFTNFYDYRSYIEMITLEGQYTPTSDVYTNNTPVYTDEIKDLARRKIEADITTYQNKIKNKVGKKETNQKRIRELEAKKADLSRLNTV